MKKCPFCAEEIQEEAIKCKHCGSILSGQTKAPDKASITGISLKETKAPLIDKELILPNEKFFFETRQHYWTPGRVFGGIVSFLFLLGAVGAVSVPDATDVRGILFLTYSPILTIIVLFWLLGWFRWRNTIYAITNKRLLQQSGILSKKMTHCAIEKIQNINLRTSFATGLGSIIFDTAGGPLPEIIWVNLGNPKAIYRQVNELIERIKPGQFVQSAV